MTNKLYKGNLGADNRIQLCEANIFEIAVKTLGLEGMSTSREGTKAKIKNAYLLLKEIAEEI